VRPVALAVLFVALLCPVSALAKTGPAPLPAAPNDPFWHEQWGPRSVAMPALWSSPTVRPILVAVVDTGADAGQPDLAGALVPGWNTLAGSADTRDDNGHGTMVAGVVAGRSNNRLGGAGYCPSCRVMPVKALDAAGRGTGDAIAAGIDWAVEHGAEIVNLSLVLTDDDATVDAAIARAVHAGVVVVAAAGNGGSTAPTFPAVVPGVVSVGAADPAGSLYPWSNSGDWLALTAPGCNVTTFAGGAFGDFCGTSSAAAAVSGVIGAVLTKTTSTAPAVAASLTAAHRLDPAGTRALMPRGPRVRAPRRMLQARAD
jgi:subtilisin family serine protease